ncbi:unnamed protein product [Calypogeia fissa]
MMVMRENGRAENISGAESSTVGKLETRVKSLSRGLLKGPSGPRFLIKSGPASEGTGRGGMETGCVSDLRGNGALVPVSECVAYVSSKKVENGMPNSSSLLV